MHGNPNLDYRIKWTNALIKLGVHIIKLTEYQQTVPKWYRHIGIQKMNIIADFSQLETNCNCIRLYNKKV